MNSNDPNERAAEENSNEETTANEQATAERAATDDGKVSDSDLDNAAGGWSFDSLE